MGGAAAVQVCNTATPERRLWSGVIAHQNSKYEGEPQIIIGQLTLSANRQEGLRSLSLSDFGNNSTLRFCLYWHDASEAVSEPRPTASFFRKSGECGTTLAATGLHGAAGDHTAPCTTRQRIEAYSGLLNRSRWQPFFFCLRRRRPCAEAA